MLLPTVGIICKRSSNFAANHQKTSTDCSFDDRLAEAIIVNGAAPLEIRPPLSLTASSITNCDMPQKYRETFETQFQHCNGFILQDGDTVHEYERAVALYAYLNDIPLLGIGSATDIIQNEACNTSRCYQQKCEVRFKPKDKYAINLDPDSRLYEIVGEGTLAVYHPELTTYSQIPSNKLRAAAHSIHGHYIEAVEAPDKRFYLSVRFRPELSYEEDDKVNRIFAAFISAL